MPRTAATSRATASNRSLASARVTATSRTAADGSGGGGVTEDMTFLSEVIVGVGGQATITFSSISGAYRHLMLVWVAASDQAGAQAIKIQFNGDTAGNYDYQDFFVNNATISGAGSVAQTKMRIGSIPGTGAQAGAMSGGYAVFPYYINTTQDKGFISHELRVDGTAASNQSQNHESGAWRTSNAAITQIVVIPDAGNFVQNSMFSLYGLT